MAMTKGYCTNCNKDNEARRIFDVNSDVKFCYCPHCGKKYRPRIAIHNYKRTIDKYLKRANFFLRNAGETRDAYNLFAYVLELEPTNKSAKLGRLLSLAYLSTVRRQRFLEVRELLDIEKELFHRPGIHDEYVEFLLSLGRCTDTYIANVKKRVTMRGYYFDVECAKLYYRHIRSIIELRRLIVSELAAINEQKLSSDVNDSIKVLENEYNNIIVTVDGWDHFLANFSKTGDPLITNGRRKIDTKLSRYRMSTLDESNKQLNIIEDEAFSKIFRRMHRAYKPAIPLACITGLTSATLLVFYFIFRKLDCAPYILSLVIFFGIIAISFVVMRVLFGLVLKKPKF